MPRVWPDRSVEHHKAARKWQGGQVHQDAGIGWHQFAGAAALPSAHAAEHEA